jgi:predicted RNase H-like HicB family nuclease
MGEAIQFHLEGLKLEDYKIPEAKTTSTYIEALV